MKKYIITSIELLISLSILSQTCEQGESILELNVNNIRASLRLGGDMFGIDKEPKFIIKDNGSKIASLYATSLWMCGKTESGNIKISAQTNREIQQSYRPYGSSQIECDKWDKHWSILKEEIKAHITDWNDNHIIDNKFKSIYSWPGIGNPYFESQNAIALPVNIDSFAPFYDRNKDGLYNPDDGDYPALVDQKNGKIIIPDQLVWYMINDDGINNYVVPLKMVVQITAWAFKSSDKLINNTIFTRHNMIYVGQEKLLNFKAAIWSAMDLGCPKDDYIGCNKDLSCFFSYNKDSIDGSNGIECDSSITFKDDPGVQAISFLSQDMNSFIYQSIYNTQTKTTFFYVEDYRFMNSQFKDGTHLKYGGNGYKTGPDTDFAFDGNPNDLNQWSMRSANLQNIDNYKALGTIAFGDLNPGDNKSFTTAYTYFNNPDLKSTNADLDSMYAGVKRLHMIYDNFFDGYTTATIEIQGTDIRISPNPAHNILTITNSNVTQYAIIITDVYGHVLINKKAETPDYTIDVSDLSSGSYFVQILSNGIKTTKQVIIIK